MATRLIIGTGYLGSRLAEAWHSRGDTVYTVTRSPERATLLAAKGFKPIVADVTQPDTLRQLPVSSTAVFCVAYDRHGEASPHRVYVEGLCNVLASPAGESDCIVQISSTGVYGDHAGGWIDESSPTRPVRPSAKALFEAENALRSSRPGQGSLVLRLAGIYGPGRIPLLRNLQQATGLSGFAQAVINLIHIEDAVSAVLLTSNRASQPNIYNVADGNPVTRFAFYAELARLLDLPYPKFEGSSSDGNGGCSGSATGAAASRGTGHKMVSNAKIRLELGFACRYPSYKEGLRAIFQELDFCNLGS